MARSVYKQPTYKNIHDSTSSKTPRPPSLPDYVVHLRSRIWEGVTARVMKVHLSLLTGRMFVYTHMQMNPCLLFILICHGLVRDVM